MEHRVRLVNNCRFGSDSVICRKESEPMIDNTKLTSCEFVSPFHRIEEPF